MTTNNSKSRGLTSLTPDQLTEVLRLMDGADSVELKLTVPEKDQRTTAASLGLDPLDAQIRQVYFYDTPDLVLNKAGLVVRSRRIQNKEGDTVVKLRPIEPAEMAERLRSDPEFKIEVDTMPGGFVCSASMKGVTTRDAPRKVALGQQSIRKLFSKAQRKFYEAHAPEGLSLDDLSVLGPITVFKLRYAPKDFSRRITAELWMYPDNTRVFELSTKCAPKDAVKAAAEARAFLEKHGVDLGAEQKTKTATALKFFAGELKSATAPPANRRRAASSTAESPAAPAR